MQIPLKQGLAWRHLYVKPEPYITFLQVVVVPEGNFMKAIEGNTSLRLKAIALNRLHLTKKEEINKRQTPVKGTQEQTQQILQLNH